jgi:hypothetical protein
VGIRFQKMAKTLAFAAIVAALPLVAVHAENNERWGGDQNWQGRNWQNGDNGGYDGNYDGGGSFYFNGGGSGYYYPPPPTYYYPPPQTYYPPPAPYYPAPQPYYAQPYYPPVPDYYGPQIGLQFSFPIR